ncbi:hypothetical protein FVEN_g8575 [Fusarium venenatum]|uniref:FAD-binding FR-type domain-containing protein n=1 Tax=Fusarium venenatum TaxID=56646 RepID=A0A2L2TA83_9HYPO|nr:uncharacterized protein FVRRES_03440 [Fusarium venenatum]KAG8353497.1 hypothetical protein FVEN_g8575 [Fusarium venenatum]KAH7003535.1 ferric reductase NAD binding domain-containing protein [Fusarium venenatum]CEI66928.1 unnamed protein product [Fusarium venenatum]
MASHSSHSDPAFLARLARRQQMDCYALTFFAGAMASFYLAIYISLLLRRLCVEVGASRKPGIVTAIFRYMRAAALGNIPGLPSGGYTFVILGYLVINAVVTFTYLDNENMPFLSNIASRTGWMAIANLLIVILFSLKNTPVAILLASSYERLNVLHRIAGYTTLVFATVHASTYTAVFGAQNFLQHLLVKEEIFGMVALGSFITLSFAGAVLRVWWYELFYYIHISFWILAIIMTGLHQPEPGKKVLYIVCVSAGIWAVCRIVRFGRLASNSINNTVTLTPLPNGGTRVTLAKAPLGSTSGKHGFLWVPAVRALETHPFTMVAVDPLEFVVSAYDGFTQKLHDCALQNPGIKLKASVEGPYGTLPDIRGYDKVIFVAGGSGASFTVGAALNMLKKLNRNEEIVIEFIWMIRNQAYLSWFAHHLETLHRDHRVSTRVYVTRASASESAPHRQPSTSSNTSSSSTFVNPNPDKEIITQPSTAVIARSSPDLEKDGISSPTSITTHSSQGDTVVFSGRPDVASLVKESTESTPSYKRVLVMGCGPKTLMSAVQNAAADAIMDNGAGVELHLEKFGW